MKQEQHIAVFGGSGSGKTVLLSTLFGISSESDVIREAGHRVVAMDVGQGDYLRSMYLGMKSDHRAPRATKFAADSYRFELRPVADDPGQTTEAVDVVWHDYPGEWFEETPPTDTEKARRVQAFRALMSSQVALILVDGQQLLAHQGEEARYLKGLLSNFTNVLAALRNYILEDGERLNQFPRIWTVALSKADLLPQMTADTLRDLIVLRAHHELNELRAEIGEYVNAPEALSVGEDHLLLSSGRFEPDVIDLSKRIGLDLLFPIATLLPFERYLQWQKRVDHVGKVAVDLLGTAAQVHRILSAGMLPLDRLPAWAKKAARLVTLAANAAPLAEQKLQDVLAEAREQKQPLRVMLARFGLALERGQKDGVLRVSEQ